LLKKVDFEPGMKELRIDVAIESSDNDKDGLTSE